MIPYFEIPSLQLGPVSIHAFGILTVVGIAVGARLAQRRAQALGLDVQALSGLWGYILVGAWLGSHLFHVALYHPEELRRDPWQLVAIWRGFASFGAITGGTLGAAIFFRRARLPVLGYADAVAYGLAPGWMFGRIGCFLVHDHPGVRTSFPLAVAFPGGARHDLGLYEALLLAALSVLVALQARRHTRSGSAMALFILLYMPARFLMDFLRATDGYADARYLGLTPGQWLAGPFFLAGAWMAWRPRGASDDLTRQGHPQSI